jgi:DNA-binding LacI/PurR family transcriptional regulator
LLANGRREAHREKELLAAFAGFRVEGVILLAPVVEQTALRAAAAAQPLVVVSRPDVHVTGVDTVVNDEAEGVRLVVDHLVDLGHQNIAHIAGQGSAAPERQQGYETAMRAHKLQDRIHVVPGSYDEQGGYEGARALLSGSSRPTAIIVANDMAAMGALTAIDEAGLRVPEDISVVGYDNTSLAALRHISLTSVNQPRQQMGRLAAEMLHDRIEGRRTRARRQVVTPTLVTRRSTGPGPERSGDPQDVDAAASK